MAQSKLARPWGAIWFVAIFVTASALLSTSHVHLMFASYFPYVDTNCHILEHEDVEMMRQFVVEEV